MMDDSDYEEVGFFTLIIDGRQYAVPQYCPHRAGKLRYGYINVIRKTITCPLHHSVFCLESGKQLAGFECGVLNVKRSSGECVDARGATPFDDEASVNEITRRG